MAEYLPEIVEGVTLWEMLERRVDRTPERLFLIDDRDRRVTFGVFRDWCLRVAAGLRARGIEESTPVAWQMPTCIEAVVLSMALARLGAIQNPMIPLYREAEVSHVLRETGARFFVVPDAWRGFSYREMAEGIRQRATHHFEILCVDDGLPEGDATALPDPPRDGSAVRWLYATSGTTSAAKIVCHSDASLIAGGIGLATAWDPRHDDIGSIPFPYAHIGGADHLVMQIRCELPALLLDAFRMPDSLESMRREGVTLTGGGPAHYQLLLEEQRRSPGQPILPTLRLLGGGGAPLSRELYWAVRHELGAVLLHGYGMTECPMISSGSPLDTDEELAETEGRPVLGCEILIVDDDANELPVETDGEVLVRGPMLAHGYLAPELNTRAFRADGFFHTGDRGHLRKDGHVVITGRSKDLIIRKGENINPLEIEAVLMGDPRVAAAAVVGLPDPSRGELVCAVVETAAGQRTLDFSEMQAICQAAGLMVQKIPERLEIVASLPRNATLKVVKHELVARFSGAARDVGGS